MTRLRIGLGVGATFACLLGVSAFVPANAGPQNVSVPLLRLDVVATNDLGGALDTESAGESPTEFTLPLASLAPGLYEIEVTGQNQHGVMSDRVTFRVES